MSYQIFWAREIPQNRDLINWVINNAPKVTCDGIFLVQLFWNVFWPNLDMLNPTKIVPKFFEHWKGLKIAI